MLREVAAILAEQDGGSCRRVFQHVREHHTQECHERNSHTNPGSPRQDLRHPCGSGAGEMRHRFGARQCARHGQPGRRHVTAEEVRAPAFLPCRDRDPHAACGTRQDRRHQAMHQRHSGPAHATLAKRQVRLVHHDVDAIAAARAAPEPEAEADIHRPIAESVRHPLHEHVPWCRERIDLSPGPLEVGR